MEKIIKNKQQDKLNTVSLLELDLSLIEEDPDQPRTEFDPVTLQELADTIRLRGVKTPISVHPNPEKEGRFIINHGARRFRASKLALKKTIPAFVDTDYSKVDQVIENLQRDALTPREIADFIGHQYSKGLKNFEVAKMIGKSTSFVSQHHTLLNLPNTIATLFDNGKVRDVIIINDLVKAFKASPETVIEWAKDPEQEITRKSVELLRQFIKTEIKQNPSAKSYPDTKSPNRKNKIDQQHFSTENTEKLLSLLEQFYKDVGSQKDTSVKALNSLTKTEQKKLTSLLDKLVNFAKA